MVEVFRGARNFLFENRENYENAYKNFRWPNFNRFNWALDWFDQIALGPRGSQAALWVEEEDGARINLSFRELADRSSQIANYLRKLGLTRGNRVLLVMGNIPQLWETTLAAMKIGAVIIPATTLLTPDDITQRVIGAGIHSVVSTTEHIEKFRNVDANCTRIAVGERVQGWHQYEDGYAASSKFESLGETNASDPFLLFFTSGTTANPKLVVHSHASYPIGHLSTMYWLGLKPADIHFNLSSPGWAKHSWSCFFAPWNAEATVFIHNQTRFNALGLLNSLVRNGVTSFCAPPTVWRLLVKEDLGNWKVRLREVASAGEPLNPEVIDRVRVAWGLTIRDGYGQTETTLMIGNTPGQTLKVGSMGRPLPDYRPVLLDSDGNQSAEGEIAIPLDLRPVGLTPGYYSDTGVQAPLGGQYYRTGDIAFRDPEGYYTFVGRADDVFKSSDYRISPFELESALIKHASVVECAVVPSPDPIRLCVPKAFIALRGGSEPSRTMALSIFQHARKVLAPFKRVRRIEFVDLPKTISGKIRRVELRTKEATLAKTATRPQGEYREEDFPELK